MTYPQQGPERALTPKSFVGRSSNESTKKN